MAVNTDVTITFNAKDRASQVADGVSKSINKMGDSFATQMKSAGLMASGIIATLGLAGAKMLDVASNIEQARISFDVMTGSGEKAAQLMKDMSDFAVKTPFELPGVIQAGKQLMAMGAGIEDVLPELKMMGDIAAGTGAPLERLIINFGQVRLQGQLTGRELRDFAVNGVDLVGELGKMMNKTTQEIKEMVESGDIGFDDVKQAFANMTGEGGKFFNLMERQSTSFGGVMSNIRDEITRTVASIMGIDVSGDIREGSIFAMAKKGAETLLEVLGKATPALTKFADAFTKNQTAVWAALGAIFALVAVAVVGLLATLAGGLAPLLAFIAAGAALGVWFSTLKQQFEEAKRSIDEFWIPAWQTAKDFMSTKLDEINSKITESGNWWKEQFSTFRDWFLNEFVGNIEEGWGRVGAALQMNSDQWADALGFTLGQMQQWVMEQFMAWDLWKMNTSAQLEEIKNNAIISMGEWMMTTQKNHEEWNKKFNIGMQVWAKNTATTIWNWVGDTTSAFFQWKENVWRAIDSLMKQAASFFENRLEQWRVGVPRILEELRKAFDTSIGWITGLFKTLGGVIDSAKSKIESFVNRFKEAQGLGQSFEAGGVVPGPIGTPVPIIAHAGEKVVPAPATGGSNIGGGNGGINFNIYVGLYAGSEIEKRNIARELYTALLEVANSQNKNVAEFMGG